MNRSLLFHWLTLYHIASAHAKIKTPQIQSASKEKFFKPKKNVYFGGTKVSVMAKSYTTLPDDKPVQWLVHELEVAYGLSESATAAPVRSHRIAFWEAIRSGISQSAFERIRQQSPFSDTDWASFLDISTKSLHRYRQDTAHRFKPGQSETILEVAELCTLGVKVLGSPKAYEHWLHTPNAALAGERPLSLVGSSFGHQLLLDELTRIDHGIFA